MARGTDGYSGDGGVKLGSAQPISKPDAKVVDRAARDRAALLLRRLIAGQITNDDFENEMPITTDPVIGAIWDTAWLFYSDSQTHFLTGRDRLHPDAKRGCVRWILFLDSDCPYEWPDMPLAGNDPAARAEAGLLSRLREFLGKDGRSDRIKAFDAAGHYPVWPFISHKDFRFALRNPRRLKAQKRI